nr:hypothetical protein [Tanacetum cinerariifolium]
MSEKGRRISQPRRERGRTDELTAELRPHPEPNNTPYGKLIRIEFPKFSGDDVKDWVYRCKQFFKVDGVPNGRKIQLAFMHMFDVALVWYQQYVKKYHDNTLWEHFEVEVVKRFGVLYDDPIVELKNLKQTGSVQHCQGVFEALLNKVDLPEPIAVSMFIGGLKPQVRTPMRMFQANTLSEAYQLARMQEATNTILKPRYNTPLLLTPKQSTPTTTYASKAMTTPTKTNSVGQNKVCTGHKFNGQLHSIEVIAEGDLDNYIDGDDETYEDCVGGCEMVLGIQWLATLGDIQCNFKKLIMKFDHKGRQLVLTGITNTHVHWMEGNEEMMKQAELSSMALCVYPAVMSNGECWNCICTGRASSHTICYHTNKKLTTPIQFKWLPKLLGYDYEIVYKKGSENVVADALSRVDSSGELLQIIVSSVSSGVWDMVKDSWKNDLDTQNLIKSLENHSYKGNKYSWTGEILKRKGKVVVENDPKLRKELVQHFHDEAIGGHSGAHVTMKKLGPLFYWKGLKKMVKQMIRDCDVCQRHKRDLSAYPGLIQPLPIPEKIWKEISMDFIEKLPKSHGKSVILVVVDRLSKYAHFIPLTHPFTASQVAQVFLDQVYKLHGLRESITKVVNKSLGCYLRCMCGEKPKEWVKWLPLAEFWYNTNYHTSTETTPYEAVYRQTPHLHVPMFLTYIPGDSRVEEVDTTLQAREEAIKVLKFYLKRSQDRMKNRANKHRTNRQFEVGDWVYLKLQPRRQVSIRKGQQHKLSPKYYGPFKVAKRIGEVAYKLELSNSSQIHPVFHISQLKKCHGKDHSVGVLPQLREDGLLENKPMAILERRLGKVNNKPLMFVQSCLCLFSGPINQLMKQLGKSMEI